MQQMSVMRQRQTGLTLISWMVILVLVGILAMTVIRLFPVYMEHLGVTSSMDSLKSDPDLQGAGVSEIRNGLMRRLDINDVKRVNADNVNITREGTMYRVNVAYEVVVPFIYNVSFLVSFDDTVEIGAR